MPSLPTTSDFFVFQFCDVAKVVMIHIEDLAKFGYKLNMKIETFKHISRFLATYLNDVL